MTTHEKAIRDAVAICAEELDELDADWAVGGATAMGIRGYDRATKDIDLFVGDDARRELLDRLTDRGLPVKALMAPFHYRVSPENRKDPDASIDLMFPSLGPEALGIMAATRAKVCGVSMPVMPLPHLVAIKLGTDPAIDPARAAKDGADLMALRDRGLIDVNRVFVVLEDSRDPASRRRLGSLMDGTLDQQLPALSLKR